MNQILCFGDSNTYGLVPGTTERFGWGIRWTSILDECVRRKNYRVIEEGLCGRTTIFDDRYRRGRKGTAMVPILLETHSPIDIVVLMLGTNDCKTAYGATSGRIGEGIEELIDQIQFFNPDIQIVLVSPIVLGAKVWEKGYDIEFDKNSILVSRELPDIYERIAKKRGIEFLAASGCAKSSSIDQEHMDKDSHRYFAAAISDKIENMIVRTSISREEKTPCYEEVAS